ncbi:WD40 repeat-like protein [Lophiostoma macrostomum CBS 122681]|uniref:WD40 repeat-like protein n=1 Tax=Lophiostoma macrostomum CBS 122681 TaxID=1314788 RepID=A0A6A6TGB9_9PLEO|nr:WD40 repeat-like protein [Lophiostoma macrostomum CBS 122681]
MSPTLDHECTRVPVTALAWTNEITFAADGPILRVYHSKDFKPLTSHRIFKDQCIHGISVKSTAQHGKAILAIWGGTFVRFVQVCHTWYSTDDPGDLLFSPVIKVPDWILCLQFDPSNENVSPEPSEECSPSKISEDMSSPEAPEVRSSVSEELDSQYVAAALTAHNELIKLTVDLSGIDASSNHSSTSSSSDTMANHEFPLVVHLERLTSSSRSILYSAHLRWETSDHILVAAGTAFGEIIFWSWKRKTMMHSQRSQVHKVFLGHEGSVFGVHISDYLGESANFLSRRFLASCSDDRTIRIWDVTDLITNNVADDSPDEHSDIRRVRHTGFVNSSIDVDHSPSSSTCAAIGWGHLSRVWTSRFLALGGENGSNSYLCSVGEDATSRLWQLVPNMNEQNLVLRLVHKSIAAFHSGKNIWSTTICYHDRRRLGVITGAADGKIVYHTFPVRLGTSDCPKEIHEYTVQDVSGISSTSPNASLTPQSIASQKSSKAADFFRSYAFVGASTFLLTKNSGRVYLQTLDSTPGAVRRVSSSHLVAELEDLRGYSTSCAQSSLGLAFVAGSNGSIYAFRNGFRDLQKIHTFQRKVSSMFCAKGGPNETCTVRVIVTLMGQQAAHLLCVDSLQEEGSIRFSTIRIPLPELLTGIVVTSMTCTSKTAGELLIVLGFRGGSIGIYASEDRGTKGLKTRTTEASLLRVIEKVHGKETVTSLVWIPTESQPAYGHLVSVGRDGCCAIHLINLDKDAISLVHHLSLPIGTNIEGIYEHNGHLLVYGFSSTKFMVYDTNDEEEIMNIETGGSHRSWAFQPHASREGGGTLIWTRASGMHICSQNGPNHRVIRAGGHGREIKSVAVSQNLDVAMDTQLIATGAEDTDIKIFEYDGLDLTCRRTLQRHTTGIQHLQWSESGEYLFSSGGCEEFYIWRIRRLPGFMGIGVVCESVYMPESEHSDLRIMSFDVRTREGTESGFLIVMVFSDSHMRLYSYDPSGAVKWATLAKGTYFTSCLTQCLFFSSNTILTGGTDGHVVFWPLSPEIHRPHSATPKSPAILHWEQPARIHQNTSKTLDTTVLESGARLVVSGGDDESLAFLLIQPTSETKANHIPSHAPSPVIVNRAHAAAVTACVILSLQGRVYVLSSGNDQWIRLWEVIPNPMHTMNSSHGVQTSNAPASQDPLSVRRLRKIRSNVADMSSMAILSHSESATRVLTCGVGMEVVRIDWT